MKERRGRSDHTEEDSVSLGAAIGVTPPQAMGHLGYQKLEEARKDSPRESLERAQSYQHLDSDPVRLISDF